MPAAETFRVYSTTYCAYCRAAKQLLESKRLPVVEIDVTGDDEARRQLRESTGRMTVPQIYYGNEYIGGYDDLQVWLRDRPAIGGAA